MRYCAWVVVWLSMLGAPGVAQEFVPPVVDAEPPPDYLPPPVDTIVEPGEGLYPFAPPPREEPPKKIWSGDLDLGLNGTDGNSNTLQLRVNTGVKRETEANIFKSTLLFMYATTDSKVVENQLLFNARDEAILEGSPWALFGSSAVQLDQFKAYDARIAVHGGISYMVIKVEGTEVKVRLGAGTSREIGGPSNIFTPEANFGAELSHQLTERQKITATIDYYPNWTAWSDYRWQTEAAWEMLIDPEWNLNLRLGVADYYDSTPEGAKRNDLKYFASLLWKY